MPQKTAFDLFVLLFEKHLTTSSSQEKAFEIAVDDWKLFYEFEPPVKTFESFRVRRSAAIKGKVILEDRHFPNSVVAPRPSSYVALVFN